MMTGEQKAMVSELKARIALTTGAPSGAAAEVREAVLMLKKELRRDGRGTARELAAALGVHESTLSRW